MYVSKQLASPKIQHERDTIVCTLHYDSGIYIYGVACGVHDRGTKLLLWCTCGMLVFVRFTTIRVCIYGVACGVHDRGTKLLSWCTCGHFSVCTLYYDSGMYIGCGLLRARQRHKRILVHMRLF